MTKADKAVEKAERPAHLFKPGKSGNPAGRPPGKSAAQKLREAIGQGVDEIIKKLTEQAKEGDVAAARLLLERVLPPVKASDEPQQIDIPEDGTLTEKGQAVLKAAADGLIPVSHAASLMTAIGGLAKVAEVDELARRIAALEAKSA
ncbi:DUF5681 domain-containing protein [Polaromonas sp.]|uniref:DUF5681 domain-containing protein n=1 Tax=Polaromonas sp. TaxID=1869339 RepID=UPI00352B3B4A